MDLDFLEIGTCNFKTLLQDATDNLIGMSVEPIKYYLDNLPNKENIKKINCAISADDTEGEVTIFYVHENIVNQKSLPRWVKGSNRIGNPHPSFKRLIDEGKLAREDIIEEKVKQIPISKLLTDYNIKSINVFKIDTEGSDCYILLHLKKYLISKTDDYYPKKIIFETNFLTERSLVDKVITEYKELGYELVSRKLDTILEKRKN